MLRNFPLLVDEESSQDEISPLEWYHQYCEFRHMAAFMISNEIVQDACCKNNPCYVIRISLERPHEHPTFLHQNAKHIFRYPSSSTQSVVENCLVVWSWVKFFTENGFIMLVLRGKASSATITIGSSEFVPGRYFFLGIPKYKNKIVARIS